MRTEITQQTISLSLNVSIIGVGRGYCGAIDPGQDARLAELQSMKNRIESKNGNKMTLSVLTKLILPASQAAAIEH